jgi:hypothetical protein
MDKAKLSSSDSNEMVNGTEKVVHMLLGAKPNNILKSPTSARLAAAAAPV